MAQQLPQHGNGARAQGWAEALVALLVGGEQRAHRGILRVARRPAVPAIDAQCEQQGHAAGGAGRHQAPQPVRADQVEQRRGRDQVGRRPRQRFQLVRQVELAAHDRGVEARPTETQCFVDARVAPQLRRRATRRLACGR